MSKRGTNRDEPAETVAIQLGIDADSNAAEFPTEITKRPPPFSDFVAQKRPGRPPKENPKVKLTVRLDAEIVEEFRATGEGWQTRMNDALRTYLREHPRKVA
jgi:uncharacterized protein (DUF4415 family)